MRRCVAILSLFVLLLALVACAGVTSTTVSDDDLAGTPTVYAKVVNPPNPVLFGHWRRSPPVELSKPWIFNYWLVKKGDKLAVYYHYDSRKKNAYKGWADFTIDGDRMVSGVDGSVFYVENGEVYMQVAGRDRPYKMEKKDD